MEVRLETIAEKKLVGKRLTTSFTNNRTMELWKSFMPRRRAIQSVIGTNLFSVQRYSSDYFLNFNPAKEFEKWAAMEVSNFNTVPTEMEKMTISPGLYAVFIHKGTASEGSKTFQHIFGTWLPQSAYLLDDRPHFEILGQQYAANDPASQEEIWIPVMVKKR